MSRKPNPPPDDKDQAAKFVETAKLLEADKNKDAFESALAVIVPPSPKPQKTKSTA